MTDSIPDVNSNHNAKLDLHLTQMQTANSQALNRNNLPHT